MSFFAILALAFVAWAFFLIGSGTNTASVVAAIIFVPAIIALYFSPAIVAKWRKHPQTMPIAVLNTLLGWTLLGWVVALVWAYTAQAPKIEAAR